MLEIYIVYRLCTSLGTKLRAKGRNPLGLQFLLVFGWLGCEFLGGVVGYVVGLIATGNDGAATLFGLVGAVCGVIAASVTVFQIAKALPSTYQPDEYDRDDAYGPGWRERDRERLRRADDGYDRDRHDDGIRDHPDERPRRRSDDRAQE